jgi:hypothetical protein
MQGKPERGDPSGFGVKRSATVIESDTASSEKDRRDDHVYGLYSIMSIERIPQIMRTRTVRRPEEQRWIAKNPYFGLSICVTCSRSFSK